MDASIAAKVDASCNKFEALIAATTSTSITIDATTSGSAARVNAIGIDDNTNLKSTISDDTTNLKSRISECKNAATMSDCENAATSDATTSRYHNKGAMIDVDKFAAMVDATTTIEFED